MRSNLVIILLLSTIPLKYHFSSAQAWIKSGYWYSGTEFPVPAINAALFTHLFCAFAHVNPSGNISISPSDQEYFSTFTDVVQRSNPAVVTLLSIWVGQENSSTFSSIISQPATRKTFIESSIRIARIYRFQGLDLCCIFPDTVSDMTNMGVFLQEWRAAADSDPANSTTQARLILTMIVRCTPTSGSTTYPLDMMQRTLDWVHLWSYDYYVPAKNNFTHFHAALYDPSSKLNTDAGIGEWTRRGFPTRKLVLGLPYHGYAWTLEKPNESNLGAPVKGPAITQDGSSSGGVEQWSTKGESRWGGAEARSTA